MTTNDFSGMTKSQLRTYVISHPDEEAAFHALVNYSTKEASSETFDIPDSISELVEVDRLIKQKLIQLQSS